MAIASTEGASCDAAVGNERLSSRFTAEHAKRLADYDDDWRKLADAIGPLAAQGVSLDELIERHRIYKGTYHGFLPDFVHRVVPDLDLARFADQPPPFRLAVVEGRYVSRLEPPTQDGLLEVVARCVDPAVDCIVEFGSGLGFNLAWLRRRLRTAALTYVACEPSEGGRRAASLIFGTEPDAAFEAHPFDYAAPDFSALRRFRKIVAFTCHSIEQMPVLGERFYRALLDTNIACCVHIEPVGWQRFTNIAEAVRSMHDDHDAWMRQAASYKFVLEDQSVVDNAAMWSGLCGYNIDLLPLISDAAARGDLALFALAYDVVGINPFNPSTLIAWRRLRR